MFTVHTGAETIQGRKLFKGGNYSQKYGKYNVTQQNEFLLATLLLLRTNIRTLFKNLTLNSTTLIWLTLIFRLSTDVGDWQQQEQSSKFEKAHSLTIPNSQYVCMWYIVQLHYHQLGTFRDAQC